MTVEDLKEMSDIFEYANHTDEFHTRIKDGVSIITEVTDEEFSRDLDKCNDNEIIEVKDVFAYPFGFYIKRNAELLKRKGFKLAFTSDDGINEKNTDPMYLKRNAIPYFIDMEAFKKIIR